MVFARTGEVVARHQLEHKQIHPGEPGLTEHDPLEIWDDILKCISISMNTAGLTAKDIAALGITNQRETTVVWNRKSGKPYHNAIVWNDVRTASRCEELSLDRGRDRFKAITGLPLAPYFSASKISWLLDNVTGLREDAENGVALFGTIDSWILWNLTAGKTHATDVTNASRTLLMNIASLSWEESVCNVFKVPMKMLPTIVSSSEVIGEVESNSQTLITQPPPELRGVTISGILGDQQAALFGQACFEAGQVS